MDTLDWWWFVQFFKYWFIFLVRIKRHQLTSVDKNCIPHCLCWEQETITHFNLLVIVFPFIGFLLFLSTKHYSLISSLSVNAIEAAYVAFPVWFYCVWFCLSVNKTISFSNVYPYLGSMRFSKPDTFEETFKSLKFIWENKSFVPHKQD
jgi:hypothetical protein